LVGQTKKDEIEKEEKGIGIKNRPIKRPGLIF